MCRGQAACAGREGGRLRAPHAFACAAFRHPSPPVPGHLAQRCGAHISLTPILPYLPRQARSQASGQFAGGNVLAEMQKRALSNFKR